MKKRDQAYQKYIKSTNFAIKTKHREEYILLRNKITLLIRNSKQKYFEEYFKKMLPILETSGGALTK